MIQNHQEAKDNISDFSTQNDQRQPELGRKEAFLSKCVKYQDITIFKKKFKVGENVLIRTTNQSELIGLILNFYAFQQEDKTIVPLVEVQWQFQQMSRYCTFSELPETFDRDLFSEYELFLTEQITLLFIDSIYGKCFVLSIEEFENLDTTNAYFCRAKFNTQTKLLDPPISLWKKVCICEQPQNPDLLYIQCDKCNRWFHLQCMGLTQEQANQMEQYSCKSCIQL